jgi:hypothetical protein
MSWANWLAATINSGAAICASVLLVAWIGKRWLDYHDALVEKQQAQIHQRPTCHWNER